MLSMKLSCAVFFIIYYCKVVYHHGMARPCVTDGGGGLQIWRVTAYILHKQPRSSEKRWSSSLGVVQGANSFSP
jgi:hypothetical protein